MYNVLAHSVFSFVIILIALFLDGYWGFSYSIKAETQMYILCDALFNSFIIFFFYSNRFLLLKNLKESYKDRFHYFCSQYHWLIMVLLLFAIYQARQSLNLILMGVPRHELITEYDRMGIPYIILSNFFKIICPFAYFFDVNKITKILCSTGLICVLIITASRNELAFVVYLYFSLMIFGFDSRKLLKLIVVFVIIVFLAVLSTSMLQGRNISDGLNGFFDVVGSHFLYKSYSFYLSEISLKAANYLDKVFYPFFGYISEKVLAGFIVIDTPIDSDFVSRLHYLGFNSEWNDSYLANVVYPLWSWFVGVFGFVGLFIKALYLYFLLYMFFNLGYFVSLVYITCYVLYLSPSSTLFLTFSSCVTFFSCIFIDYFSSKKIKLHYIG